MENRKEPSEFEFVFYDQANDGEMHELEETIDVLADSIPAEFMYKYRVNTNSGSYLKLSFFDSEAMPQSNGYQIVIGDGPGDKVALVYSFDRDFNFLPFQSLISTNKRLLWEVMSDLNNESCPMDKDERDILNCLTESLREDTDPDTLTTYIDGVETEIPIAELVGQKVQQKSGYVTVSQNLEVELASDRRLYLILNQCRILPLDCSHYTSGQTSDLETRIELVEIDCDKKYVFTRHSAFPSTLEISLIDTNNPEYVDETPENDEDNGEIARFRRQIKKTSEIPLKNDVLYLSEVLDGAYSACMAIKARFN